jgi:hypothetical protein
MCCGLLAAADAVVEETHETAEHRLKLSQPPIRWEDHQALRTVRDSRGGQQPIHHQWRGRKGRAGLVADHAAGHCASKLGRQRGRWILIDRPEEELAAVSAEEKQ